MSDDLVDRLRDITTWKHEKGIINEAADEIERLRKALSPYGLEMATYVSELRELNERLHRDRDGLLAAIRLYLPAPDADARYAAEAVQNLRKLLADRRKP